MRVVLQRVLEASVEIEGTIHSQIGKGILVLACWEETDNEEDLAWIAGHDHVGI
ncbi:MAG: hypothetical protein EOP00_31800, partial [Pedobacter sp.]